MRIIPTALRLGVLAIGAGLPLVSMAQSDSGRIEEIMVTAERREASIQDVPIAVSAFDAGALEKFQVDETIELINIIPNLFGGNNTGLGTANMYYLRAQGNDESIATFDPPVGTYVDDVYITRQNANNFMFFDVERMEVLRGPQGTLFGRNTTGGAINVILKKPSAERSGFVEVGYGRWNAFIARGTVDLPINDSFRTKFSAFSLTDDGWLDNTVDGRTYNDRSNYGVRGAVQFVPNDTFVWDLSLDYIDSSEANVFGQVITDSRRESSSALPSTGIPAGVGTQKTDYGNTTKTLSFVSNIGWSAFNGDANFIVGYRDLEQNFLLNFPGNGSDDFFWIDNLGQHEMTTAEVKWAGPVFNDRVNLVTGLFLLDESNSTDFADYVFGAVRLADRVLDNGTQSWAFYIQGDISIGERGTLTLGARYTDETKDIGLSDNTGGGLTTEGLIEAGIPIEQKEQVVTPRIAYRHEFSDEISGYVSATRGFKSGGWNARGTSPAAFEPFGPETIWSYEAGLRADWVDGRLRTNATFFYSDLKDLQTTAATPTGQFLTTNAGGIQNPGFELEMTALPTDNWEIFLSLGLQDAEYVDLPGGCTVPNTTLAAYDVNCNPATPKRAPDATVTFGTSASFPISGLRAALVPTFSARYIGENVVGTINQGPNERVTLINLGLSLVADSNFWQVAVECRNCTNEIYTTSFLFEPYPTPPGFWQARLKFNFGDR